ncbi:MAG TPA: diguanylate cyclase [Ureibacillus sp.]|nr:diguanylate cyclase [Ureibacillus sp.]
MFNRLEKIKLKHLMLGLIIFAFLLFEASSLFSSYQRSIHLLENQSLEKNRVYALKLSQIVDLYLDESLQTLGYSASILADYLDDEQKLNDEVNRLFYQDDVFNSVIISNSNGLILVGAPDQYELKGKTITSNEGRKQIKIQQPSISDPYRASTGKLLITVSYPIFSSEDEYVGVINGTIYIHESNFLETILSEHHYEDGSYVYVVDSKGNIIYHLDKSRLGTDVSKNQVVQNIKNNQSGAQLVINDQNEEMLAGYSPLKKVNWGVIVQTPRDVAVESIGKQVLMTFYYDLPFLIISIIIVLVLAAIITRPLQQIAVLTENSIKVSEMGKLNELNAWFYEASRIKKALIQSFSFLHGQVSILKDENSIDPLTKLTNRRALDTILQSWTAQGKMYSIIMLDIDHFKLVNDTFGHATGDEVLRFLSSQMRNSVREQDICCRYGGEEFIILLPEVGVEKAFDVAVQLRKKMETTVSPTGKTISFSAGIASFPKHAANSKELIELADQTLYKAKKLGRNRVLIFENDKGL